MRRPKQPSTGTRYLSSSAFNCRVQIIDPNQGQAEDGTPNAPAVVAYAWANVSLWRGKEVDKREERVGQTSYKVVLHYPYSYTIDTGMQIQHGSHLINLEAIADPDGRRVELHCFGWTSDDIAGQ